MLKFSMKSKAQLGGLSSIILIVLISGVLIGAGFYIFSEIQSVDQMADLAVTATNETTGYINSSGYTLTGASQPGFNSPVISAVRNGTSGTVITSGNYTLSSAGVLTNATAVVWPTVHIDYSYAKGDAGYNALNDTITAFDNVPQLLGLVVLIALIVIVLGLVFTIPGSQRGA